jgi:hypothetical protein
VLRTSGGLDNAWLFANWLGVVYVVVDIGHVLLNVLIQTEVV